MGLTSKAARLILHLKTTLFAALVPVPLSRRSNRDRDGPRETGTHHRENRVFPRFQANVSTEPVPVSRYRFHFDVIRYSLFSTKTNIAKASKIR